jgi:hypothetical protein
MSRREQTNPPYLFFHEKNTLYIQKDIKIYKDRSHGRQLNLGRMQKNLVLFGLSRLSTQNSQ